MSPLDERRRFIWVSALLLALVFLAVDTSARLRSIQAVNRLTVADDVAPRVDARSPSGYAHNQHQLILPAQGVDGYHWLMQAEQMFAGDGLRVRVSDYENPPAGREVHWSGSVRWWLAGVAVAYRTIHPELSMPRALERVAPWAGTLLFALCITLLTPVLARHLGAPAAALFALGGVAVHPFYQFNAAGLLDHHGLAALCALVTVLALIAGGGGWVHNDAPDASRHVDPVLMGGTHWFPSNQLARRWFITSAIVAGIGLWISAATMVPVLAGVGAGALLSTAWVARSEGNRAWRLEPSLWRLWGITGCITSVAFYLLEYFPQHLGMRLEVNHPLYALAWLGAGDLLHRSCAWLAGVSHNAATTAALRAADVRIDWRWVSVDVVLILLLPIIILLARAETFTVAHPFLWALHADYILEFRSLGAEFSRLNLVHALQGTTSVLPFLLLPLAALLWHSAATGYGRWWRRAILVGLLAAGLTFVHAFSFPIVAGAAQALRALPRNAAQATLLVHVVTVAVDAALYLLLFRWPLRAGLPQLAAPAHARLLLAVVPALLLLLLAFWQIRWFGVACALLLVVLITLAAQLAAAKSSFRWMTPHRVIAGLCLFWILVPFPAFTALLTWRFGYPADVDRTQVVARAVAHTLRARVADRPVNVASAPTTTTWLIYFGGFNGLGTLYWENLDGLQATAAIYGAGTDEQARELIDRHGITHIVVFSWEPFALEYARLARGQRMHDVLSRSALPNAFIIRLLQDHVPPWLTPIDYSMPALGLPADARVWIFEVNARAAAS